MKFDYSPAAAGAMKLLSTLILGGKIDVVGAAPTADIATALDDAEISAGSEEADSVLYIGGPPRSSQVWNIKSVNIILKSITIKNLSLTAKNHLSKTKCLSLHSKHSY